MKFRLKADVTFDAVNMADALDSLGTYFLDITDGRVSESQLFTTGKIVVLPADADSEVSNE